MHFRQVTHDREAQAKTTVRARDALILLPESLEDVRQKCGSDADAGIRDDELDARLHDIQRHAHRAAIGSEFDAFDKRFQITCCSRA